MYQPASRAFSIAVRRVTPDHAALARPDRSTMNADLFDWSTTNT
jgi:hypothetical protein